MQKVLNFRTMYFCRLSIKNNVLFINNPHSSKKSLLNNWKLEYLYLKLVDFLKIGEWIFINRLLKRAH